MSYEKPQPKYLTLAETLRQAIESGEYAPGGLLPSENQLSAAYEVSRPTVVRALELLKRDGWAESQQGAGTFARRPSPTPADELGRLQAWLAERFPDEHGSPVDIAIRLLSRE